MKTAFWLRDVIAHLSADAPTRACCPLQKLNAEEIWSAKLFCILSSQMPVARATVATKSVLDGVLFFDRCRDESRVEAEVYDVLSSTEVGYRFPRVKSQQIAKSWIAFAQLDVDYFDYLSACPSESRARDLVIFTFSGLGLKQASMLLRDIGFSSSLAVIDTHVLWYLYHAHDVRHPVTTKKQYESVERLMISDAESYGVDVNTFDLIVFSAVKSLKAWRPNV